MNSGIYIGVASNIHPRENIKKAFTLLNEKVNIIKSSTFYTNPSLNIVAPDFINGVWEIEADLSAMKLKCEVLIDIEERLGRVRTKDKYTPLPIDLDILLYYDLVDDKIPDREIYLRPFLGIPLLELNPELVLPDKNISLASVRYLYWEMTPDTELTQYLKSHSIYTQTD